MLIRRSFAPYRAISPWQEVENFRRLANRFPGAHARPGYPVLNVWTNEDGAIAEAKLPGVNPKDIDISVEGETVTIAGNRTAAELEDGEKDLRGEKYLRRERRYGKFNRSFELPFAIETDAVEATFKNGILRISLPKAEADKPKKIAVKTA